MAVKPISPKNAVAMKYIPDEMISSFNELIIENIDLHGRAQFTVKDVVNRAISKKLVTKKKRHQISDNNWLDVENIYGELGWNVEYNSPDMYGSQFDPYFVFSPKKENA